MCLRPIHFTDEHFSSTSKTSSLGTTLLKCRIYRIPKLLNIRLKEFCCILMMVKYPLLALLHSFLPTALSYGRWNTLLNICNCTAHSQQQLTQSAFPTSKLFIACTRVIQKISSICEYCHCNAADKMVPMCAKIVNSMARHRRNLQTFEWCLRIVLCVYNVPPHVKCSL